MRCPSFNSRMNKVVVGISIKASLLLMRLLGLRGGEHEEDDLTPDGKVAQRIRRELAAHMPLPDDCFAVRATADGRGDGLYAAPGHSIPAGTFLFDYEGRVLETDEYGALYQQADGPQADYAVGMTRPDGTSVYIDAADPAESNVARYMNHADGPAANCCAWTIVEPAPRVLIFASEDVEAGDELVWDYGESYWEGRVDKV